MKKIEAIIKPFKLDEVKEALQEVGLQGAAHAGPAAGKKAEVGARGKRGGRHHVSLVPPRQGDLRGAEERPARAASPAAASMEQVSG